MKKIAAIHAFLRYLIKKKRSTFVSPEELDDAINWASLDLQNEMYGLPEGYQSSYASKEGYVPSRTIPSIAYAPTQKVLDDLQVFLTDPTPLVIAGGIAPLPDDYLHWSKIETTNSSVRREIKVVMDDKWNHRLRRKTAAPSYESPVCRIYNNKVEFAPTDVQAVELSYLKLPTKAVWAYTIVNDRPVYDDANSVDFEWGEENHMDIMTRTLTFLGINLEQQELQSYSDMRKQTGK